MNCDTFLERLHRQLDDRLGPEADVELMRHARQCAHCGVRLDTWRKVSTLLPASTQRSESIQVNSVASEQTSVFQKPYFQKMGQRHWGWALSGLAAAMALLFVSLLNRDPSSTAQRRQGAHFSQLEVTPTQPLGGTSNAIPSDMAVDPAAWWRQLDGQAWVSRTMPTVRSVREGVAPIGRTLIRAVTILTIGGYEQTS